MMNPLLTIQTGLIRPTLTIALAANLLAIAHLHATPKAVVISLDGMTPRFVSEYLEDGTLDSGTGIGRLIAHGLTGLENTTVSPSLTAPGHIAIATGSTAAHNDVVANSFKLLLSPFFTTISGFSAPIGGYSVGIDGSHDETFATATPLWVPLRAAGKVVVTATFPGGDGLDIRIPGLPNSPIIQPSSERTVDYTVPFGATTAPFQKGFSLAAASFVPAPETTLAQLAAAGRTSFSPVLQANLETFTSGGVPYNIKAATLDTTNDGAANYDTVVFFNQAQGIQPGPFALPSTGPAYVKPATKISALFYLEGHPNKAGVRYFVSQLAPDLSTVRIARTSTPFIPRNPAVLADVDDINNNVGFWQPQPDFRIVEKLDAVPSTFANFPDLELEAIYMELVRDFVDYQARVAIRSIQQKPDADLVMTYVEQPDGSFHQFLLTDPRQPTNFLDKNSIGANQDQAKIARYRGYLREAYQVADEAVERIIQAAGGVDAYGKPKANIFVVSDHGFSPFHTAVSMNAVLGQAGFVNTKVRAATSGPAANIYINLAGRELNGTVSRQEYRALQQQIVATLQAAADTNQIYTLNGGNVPIFDKIYVRPLPADDADPSFGTGTDEFIGQDSGDVYALLKPGYNFDGTQNPVLNRLGDAASSSPVLSLPNFYGAHGYDPELPDMSAVFFSAGPAIRYGALTSLRNIDIAPTLSKLLGVAPASTVDGSAIPLGSLSLLQQVRSELEALLAEVADKHDRKALEKVLSSLDAAASTALWLDDGRVIAKEGHRVLKEIDQAAARLGLLIDSKGSALDDDTLQNYLLALASAARHVALTAVNDGSAKPEAIAAARVLLAEGDTRAAGGDATGAIKSYSAAWSRATVK